MLERENNANGTENTPDNAPANANEGVKPDVPNNAPANTNEGVKPDVPNNAPANTNEGVNLDAQIIGNGVQDEAKAAEATEAPVANGADEGVQPDAPENGQANAQAIGNGVQDEAKAAEAKEATIANGGDGDNGDATLANGADGDDTGGDTKSSDNQEYMRHWFWGPVLACRKVYGQVIVASVFINLFALASSLYIMTVYDRVIPNEAVESLWALTIIMAVVLVFDFVMKIIRGQFVDAAGARVDRIVSEKLFTRIARHDITLNKQATGALANTVREFETLKDVIGSASFSVFADLPFVLLFLVVLWMIGGPVAAVPAMVVLGVVGFGFILQPVMKRLTMSGMMQGQGKQAVMVEMISGLETIKTMSGLSMLRQRWLKSVVSQAVANRKTKFTSQLTQTVTQTGQQLSQVGIVVYGVYLITDASLTMGQLIACVILSGRTLAPLGQLTQLLGRMNQALAAYRNLGEVLSGETDEEERAGRLQREKLNGDVSVRNVHFSYEGQEDAVLHDLNFSIKAGERVGIVGSIGSGKTTILRLIAGLYKAQQGTVMIDNADVRQIRPDDLRRNLSVVFQNPTLFSGTIRENLLMGAPDASPADIIDAASAAGVEDFIATVPGGYDYPLTERGRELSSGMRQSLAIARALISKPAILLLDEPTASLDEKSEVNLIRQLEIATRGITTIIVTHRQPILQIVDKVLMVDAGRVVRQNPTNERPAANVKQIVTPSVVDFSQDWDG